MAPVRKAKRKSRVTKSDRRRVDDNIDHPDEYDARTGFAPEDISRRLEENLREKRQREALGNAFRPMGNNNNIHDVDFDGTEGDLPSPPRKSRHHRRSKAFNSLWEQHKDVIKGWFCKAASFGTPDPTLKQPYALTEVACDCNKQSSSVHVFMTHNGKCTLTLFVHVDLMNLNSL